MKREAPMHPERTDPDDAHDVWLDVVAAVEYLGRGPRWGLTVWDAVEEAVRWWMLGFIDRSTGPLDPARSRAPDDDPDPIRTAIGMTLAELPSAGIRDGWALADALQLALGDWVRAMAELYNDGRHWPAPTSTRTLPAATIDPDRFVGDPESVHDA